VWPVIPIEGLVAKVEIASLRLRSPLRPKQRGFAGQAGQACFAPRSEMKPDFFVIASPCSCFHKKTRGRGNLNATQRSLVKAPEVGIRLSKIKRAANIQLAALFCTCRLAPSR